VMGGPGEVCSRYVVFVCAHFIWKYSPTLCIYSIWAILTHWLPDVILATFRIPFTRLLFLLFLALLDKVGILTTQCVSLLFHPNFQVKIMS
jgi:hypothetical protein